ncbi:MAG: alpha/beta hydrolase [Candidatus Kapabacteria bacterium]|nr:alpha/beta hydrolase [Ignavibacteriota bacterium]MCW5884584.1 alpha/beta hydrolase [Candidatus Kapabacteria bacterium]
MNNIILLHGAIGAAVQFEPIEQRLKSNFGVYKFDFSGHGSRSEFEGELSIEQFTEDLHNFISEESLFGADVFGYSMGGYVALNYASKYPENLSNIMTLATKFDWTPESAAIESKMLNPQKIIDKVPKFAEYLKSLHGECWTQLLEKTARMIINIGNNPLINKSKLAEICNHVRISVGDRDKMVSIVESYDAFRNLNKASFAVLPDTEHPIDKINFERLIYEIETFFQG